MRDQSVYLLPPRPRRRDWLSAGLTAGAMLGLMELLVALPGDLSPPPRLALLLALADTLLVGTFGLLVGLAVEMRGVRLTHSGMVGAMLGPLIGAGLPGALWTQLPIGESAAMGLSGLAAVSLFALAAGLAGSRLCDALESSGVSVSAPLVWGATAVSMASGERILAENPGGVSLALLVAAPGLALLGVVAGHERARRRGSNLIVHPTRALGLVGGAAAVVASLPWLMPWVFYDDAMPNLEGSPPSFLMIAIDDVDAITSQAVIDLIAWNGVAYERITSESAPGPGIDGLLRAPTAFRWFSELSGRGYATHAIVTAEDRASAWPVDRVDFRAGPGGLLTGSLRWMASASLLSGPGSPLLEWFGFGGAQRTPSEINEAAGSWLLSWRTNRAPAPFLLCVDFRGSIGSEARVAERDIDALIDHLDTVAVTPRTALLAWVETPGGVRAAIRPLGDSREFSRSDDEQPAIDVGEWANRVARMANQDLTSASEAVSP